MARIEVKLISAMSRVLCPRVKSFPIPAVSANGIVRQSKLGAGILGRQSCSSRSFATTVPLYKKSAQKAKDVLHNEVGKGNAAIDDPYDFGTLKSEIESALERLRTSLSKLSGSGRFNHQLIEDLKVVIDKTSGSKARLSDVAQVIPKGRMIQIMVGEEEHVKPVSSAISSGNLSLTPQPDPKGINPLLLEIKIPPTTTESRSIAVKEASKIGEKMATSIRDARSKQHKKHAAMKTVKGIRADDINKAAKQMEKIVENGQLEVKKIVDNAKKVLESG